LKTPFPSHFNFTCQESIFCVRPIRPSDKDVLQKAFGALSEKSRYLRLFQTNNTLSKTQLDYFTEVDGIDHVAWGILDETNENSKPVGIGRFVRLKGKTDIAEVAITITDDYQGRGLGSILFATLNYIAGQMGIKKLRYYVLSENTVTLNALSKFRLLDKKNESGLTSFNIKVIPNYYALKDIEDNKRLRMAFKLIERKMKK